MSKLAWFVKMFINKIKVKLDYRRRGQIIKQLSLKIKHS